MAKKKKRFVCIGITLVLIICWIYYGNHCIITSNIVISDCLIPELFDGFVITHISDLHNECFGKENKYLVEKVKETKPDIIVITGDLIDSNNTDINVATDLVNKLSKIAPVYYVTGNHEAWCEDYSVLRDALDMPNVFALDNTFSNITRDGSSIVIAGLSDPDLLVSNDLFGDNKAIIDKRIKELNDENKGYTVLLSHRPEFMDVYSGNSVNLVLCGHAHGGQFRIPFVGGVIAPNQGFFPKYTEGVYIEGLTQMVVSRGLGNSIIPIRLNNRPELLRIELKCSED